MVIVLPGDIGRAFGRTQGARSTQKTIPVGVRLRACEHIVDTFPDQLSNGGGAACGKRFQALVLAGFQSDLSTDHGTWCYR